MTEEARQELYDIADRIAELEKQQHRIARDRREMTDRATVIRARLILEIAASSQSGGDTQVYQNAQVVEAVLTLKLSEHEEYQRIKNDLWELDDAERTLAIEHQRLVDRRTVRLLEMGWAGASSAESA